MASKRASGRPPKAHLAESPEHARALDFLTEELSQAVLDLGAGASRHELREALRRKLSIYCEEAGGEGELSLRMSPALQGMAEIEPSHLRSDISAVARMAAGLAHEIKNPLAGIQGVIEVLQDRSRDEVQRSVLRDVLGEVGRINRLVGDLISFAKPRQREMKPVALEEAARQVAEQVFARRKAIKTLRFSSGRGMGHIVVRADESDLREVFANLFNNALDANGESGSVRVELSKDGENATLRIEDSGCGVPVNLREKIFDPFFTTKSHGTGLGLALSRRIVEQHGGSLRLDGEFDQGAAFVLTLPVVNDGEEDNQFSGGPR